MAVAESEIFPAETLLRLVAPGELVENELNPRRDVGDIGEMAASIAERGVLEPLLAFERDGGADGTLRRDLVLLAGHRRRAAAIKAGVAAVPVLVRAEPAPDEQLLIMLDENGHRDSLTPLEEARSYATLVDFGVKQTDIARRCGRSDGHVSKRLAIVSKLPEPVLDLFDRREFSCEAAYQLTRVAENTSLVGRLAHSGAADADILKAVERELKARADVKAWEKTTKRLDAEKVEQVNVMALRNGTAAVLCGADDLPNDWGGVYWIGLEVDQHAGEDCHAAAVTREGRVVWVCGAPSNHKAPTLKRWQRDAATVADIVSVAQRNENAAAARRPAQTTAAESEYAGVGFDASRARSVERRRILRAIFEDSVATTDAGLNLVATVAVYDAAGGGLVAPNRERVADILGLAIDRDDPEWRDVFDGAVVAMRHTVVALGIAVARFEWALWCLPLDNDDEDGSGMSDNFDWSDACDPFLAKAYCDWLAVQGVDTGPVEREWLTMCMSEFAEDEDDE